VRVITITNQKGGTGKSTLTALLGYGLAMRGYNVLLIDLDPQAHLSSFFIPVDELENITDGVIEMAQGRPYRIREVLTTLKGRIDLIPSGINYIILAYRGLIPSWDSFAIDVQLRKLPEVAGKTYDYVICDTAPEVFPPTIWGLTAADYILIPTNYEELSMSGVKLLIKEVLPEIIPRSKRETKVVGIVLTNVVRRITPKTIATLDASFKRFLSKVSSEVRKRFYKKPFFNTTVYRFWALRDLIYRPMRWTTPLYRIIENYPSLRRAVDMLTTELIMRVERFEPLEH